MIDDNFLNEYGNILYQTEKPSRYIGDEFGSYDKDFNLVDGKFLFVFPDKYEIGISNFGHKIIYDLINKKQNLLCDRLYAPDKDFIELLDKNNKKIYALESKRQPKEFDIIGFGLQYEMSYTTVLKLLELSDIPVLSKERNDNHPLILAGGPSCANPKPMNKFIDIFIIGDGEDVNIEVLEKYLELKNKLSRNEILKELSKIQGVYVPLVDNVATKRIAQLTYENHPVNSPIPHFPSVHDRAIVELRRGCGRLCRFCQASHINLPIRERKKEDVVKLAKEYVKNTGYDEYSLLSLSSNDHSQIEDILKDLSCHFRGSGINVSLPSQRADKFSLEIANLAQSERKATVTIAPEAGTQRMRDIINKNLSQEQIINATISCVKNGWNKIKYYFVIGLPFETYDDLKGIPELIEEVNKACRENGLKYPQITCSISVFVPKPHTPFQWARQNTIEEVQEKIKFLRELKDKIKNVKFNFHNPKMSQLEAFFSRGDEKLSDFIYELYKNGAYLESWDENLDLDLYSKIADKLGINIEKTASREYLDDEILPWDNIHYGVNKTWLLDEYKKAQSAISTIPCEVKCNNCGVCSNLKTRKVICD
ncbi:MAG: TIGR03960 family B12-binding radical SAM protein [Candidatus Gastranaerophilales bacterium]|nr:TIGR03960 family B12-binding radical SAM protein [Candidatus Gastranaerophilales bacterium]